jgi:hypothetical protein
MKTEKKGLIDVICRVIVRDGIQLICLPDGTEIPHIQMTRITQDTEQASAKIGTAFVKLLVTLDNTK